jgi:hypothetical protein
MKPSVPPHPKRNIHLTTYLQGALVARDPPNGANVPGLTEEERDFILQEKTRKWVGSNIFPYP